MPTLLHLDSSIFPLAGSASRQVTDTFRKAWEQEHPDGTVVYRDLAVAPVPHLDAAAVTAPGTPEDQRSAEQQAALALREELIAELENADVVLIGAPMYNFTIASSLKAWLDQVVLMGRTAGEGGSVAGKHAVVVASRGGSYRPGTPREGFEFAHNYLEKALNGLLGLNVEVIVPELTLAATTPAMAELVPQAEESKAKAHEDATASAKAHAARLAA